jgi:hypothetical protein
MGRERMVRNLPKPQVKIQCKKVIFGLSFVLNMRSHNKQLKQMTLESLAIIVGLIVGFIEIGRFFYGILFKKKSLWRYLKISADILKISESVQKNSLYARIRMRAYKKNTSFTYYYNNGQTSV